MIQPGEFMSHQRPEVLRLWVTAHPPETRADPSSVFTLLLKMTLRSICDCRRLEFSNMWTLDVETLSAACKLKHPSVSQSSGHHRSLHPSIHPSRPAHLRLVCVFPVTEVQAPRWGLVPPGPELPPAHGGGGRSRAGPGSREEPVPDPECARIRHPRSHLTHEGRRESRLCFLSVLRLCWFVCRLCSQRLYWHPCSSSSDSLTVNMFPTNRHHMSLNLRRLVGGTCCGYWLAFTVASSVERQLLWGDGGQFDDRKYNTGNLVVV